MSKQFLYSALALCLFASCKKSDEKKLIGVWKGIVEAHDENSNGILDTDERNRGTGGDNWGYTFKKGGDAEVRESLAVPGTWQLKNSILTITAPGGSKAFRVVTLDNMDLKLEYTDDNGMKNWEELKKQ